MEGEQLWQPFLHPGMRLEVLTQDNKLIFIGELRLIEDAALHIFGLSRAYLPPVLYNTPVRLKGYLDGMRPMVLKGLICGSTSWFWKVDRLEALYVKDNRMYFRQCVNRSGRVMCVNEIFMPEGLSPSGHMQPVGCSILNISGDGILVQCQEQYQVGDWLLLMDISIVPEIKNFSFTCQVRRVEEGLGGGLYGCHLEGLEQKEQDLLLRAIFMVQRAEIEAHRQQEE